MRILITSENYLPNISGVPVVVQYLAEGLVKLNHEVTIVTRLVEGAPREEILNGVTIKRFELRYNKYTKTTKGEISEYIKFVLNLKVDILINQCAQCCTTDLILKELKNINAVKIFHSHGFSGLTLRLFSKKSTLLHTLGNTYNFIRHRYYYNFVLKKYIKEYDLCLCLSQVDSSKQYLDQYANKVEILENAANPIFFETQSTENALLRYVKLNKDYFISIANYSEVKNQKGILNAYYKAAIMDFAMVFIGRDQNEYYYDLIKENDRLQSIYGRRDVVFLTNVDRKDIPNILHNAYLYLVGSSFEEYSISLIEAMALGIPFISTNVGNASCLPGIVVENIDTLPDAIRNLIKHKDQYKILVQESKKYAEENCRTNVSINKLNDWINKLMC